MKKEVLRNEKLISRCRDPREEKSWLNTLATITAGQSSIEVKNNLVKPTTKIFITFRTNPDSFWWINKQTEGMFEVGLKNAALNDKIFDYRLVDLVQ